jgi:hypothetical protein
MDSDRVPKAVHGAEAMMEMAHQMMPRRYLASTALFGPFSVVLSTCRWKVTVLLTSNQHGRGFMVGFEFADGNLTSADGKEVALFDGEIP